MCARSLPDCKKALGVLEQWQKEERRFALWEQSANSDRYFILDPVWADARASWVSELKDIHHMQEKLLQALQAPTKAAGFSASDSFSVDPALASWMDSSTPKSETGPAVERHLSAPSQQPNRVHDTTPSSKSASCSSPFRKEHVRKWPSFSFRRPKLLLGSDPKDGSNCGTPSTVDSETASQKELRSGSNSASLTRAHSVERRGNAFKLKPCSSPGGQPRKCSLNMQQASLEHETSSVSMDQQRNKKRSLMASLLGRFKSTSSGEVPNGSNDALQQQ
ncbi:hypothetical protein Ciccas_005598 [Cichlidogyrus casuarinus]|uniref:Uncharacterized protein n=1 Tax=Cichlidogyrus casuarinus TaxID=1844966 RepID=A0ABD2Q888_9PLAT